MSAEVSLYEKLSALWPGHGVMMTQGTVCYHQFWCGLQWFASCDCDPIRVDEAEVLRRIAVSAWCRALQDQTDRPYTCTERSWFTGVRCCWPNRHPGSCGFTDGSRHWTEDHSTGRRNDAK